MIKHITLLCAAVFASLNMVIAQGSEQYASIPYSFDGFSDGKTLADYDFKSYAGSEDAANNWTVRDGVLYSRYTNYESVAILELPVFSLDKNKQYELKYVFAGDMYDDNEDYVLVKVNGVTLRTLDCKIDKSDPESYNDIVTADGDAKITFEYYTSSNGYQVFLSSISLNEKAQGAIVSSFPWSESFDGEELSWIQYDAVGEGEECAVMNGALTFTGVYDHNVRVVELPYMQLAKNEKYTFSCKVKGNGTAVDDVVRIEVDGEVIFSETANKLLHGKNVSHTITGTGNLVVIRLSYDSESECSATFDDFEIKLYEGDPNALNALGVNGHSVSKTVVDGRLVIVNDGQKFDLNGRKLK